MAFAPPASAPCCSPDAARFRRTHSAARAQARPRASGPSTPSPEAALPDEATLDSLIELFRKRPRDDWRRMLSVSAEWPRLRAGVFARLEHRAGEAGGGSELELELLKLRRVLGETDAEVGAFRALFASFLDAPPEEWEPLVAARRAALSEPFFAYLQLRISAMNPDAQAQERDEAATAAARLLALVNSHDTAVKDAAALDASFDAFQTLLSGVSSYEDIDARVAGLVKDGTLDPALMLTATKMYMSVKESPYSSEEVKDVMAHLYWRMKASLAEQQPPAVRILRLLLTLEDPQERVAAMDQAFTPGAEEISPVVGAGGEDQLCTTPDALLLVIRGVLAAYEAQRGRPSMAGQAAELMTPTVIERMRELKDEVEMRYT